MTQSEFSLRSTRLQNFITFSHSAVSLDRKEKRQKPDSIQWNGIWVCCNNTGLVFTLCHSITKVPQVTMISWSGRLPWRPWKTFFKPIARFFFLLLKTAPFRPFRIKRKRAEHAFFFPRNCLLSFKPAWRIFKFLLAESSPALISRAQLDDLKVLTNYAGEIARSSECLSINIHSSHGAVLSISSSPSVRKDWDELCLFPDCGALWKLAIPPDRASSEGAGRNEDDSPASY